MVSVQSHRVPVGESTTTVRVTGSSDRTLLLAHGAGTDQDHPHMVMLRDGLAGAGLQVVTFNYLYKEAGRRAPDRMPRLESCHTAVYDWTRQMSGAPPIMAGRSMGGRVASRLVAGGIDTPGLVLYGYPLHPAGRPDRLRAEHLPSIRVPMLFLRGTRDALASADLFDRYVRPLPLASVIDLDGADHSFRGRGWAPETSTGRLVSATVEFLDAL